MANSTLVLSGLRSPDQPKRRWLPTELRTFKPSDARRSLFVEVMRIVLPALALFLATALLLWPGLHQDDKTFRLSLGGRAAEGGPLTMLNARYSGLDRLGRPFMVTADAASQDPSDPKLVILDRFAADITLSKGEWLWLGADSGAFHEDEQVLILYGDVSLFTDKGFELHAARAEIDLRQHVLTGQGGIEAQGPLGTVRADVLKVFDNGRHVALDGNVRTTVSLHRRSRKI
jgi:lipopolysaccharide export system protein LptC